MRKVVSSLFISLDGVTESPDKWQSAFDEEMAAEMNAVMDAQDAVLMGRVTYEEWAGYWPTSTDEPFASYINAAHKYVASTTLDRADWQNTTLLKGDLTEEIARLKSEPGGNIGVAGSPGLVRSLLEQDLLDELRLMVSPVVAGAGRRLFGTDSPLKRLELEQSAQTTTGTMILVYRPAG
ncbi:dihydrofolate reductase [Nonomuraea muscovyensis]|uniref:Dihydrofolate reductase n=1 Tax=Nonomuraea muscovyensis TaxID=1124761 RepID=A0A7X0F2A0_9ACTN|nr:dihydrofolate reductase family protein [Nonomuraea muscovyensis]MBB6349926.1 dihydrofolate reductase [Nonomuraea muscovyensis]